VENVHGLPFDLPRLKEGTHPATTTVVRTVRTQKRKRGFEREGDPSDRSRASNWLTRRTRECQVRDMSNTVQTAPWQPYKLDGMSVRAVVPASVCCPHCASEHALRAWRTVAQFVYLCGKCGHAWMTDIAIISGSHRQRKAVSDIKIAVSAAPPFVAASADRRWSPPPALIMCAGCGTATANLMAFSIEGAEITAIYRCRTCGHQVDSASD
jgi:hypothetical protein